MHAVGLRRRVFVSSMGIYGEVPGERYRSVLDPYRDSVARGFRPCRSAIPADADQPFRQGDHPGRDAAG